MMRNAKNTIIFDNRIKRTAIVAAIILLLTAIASALLTFRAVDVSAETRAGKANTITLHVYDTGKGYSTLGTWIWMRGSSGIPTEGGYIADGEQFVKEAENNTAYSFDRTFSAGDIAKMREGTLLGFLVCTNDPNVSGSAVWGKYKKQTADVFVDISRVLDSNGHADVYYVRGDTVAYTDVEAAKMALEKVKSARFTGKNATSVDVAFDSTTILTPNTTVELHQNGEKISETKAVLAAGLQTAYDATAKFTGVSFDFASSYMLYIKDVPTGAAVSMNAFIDDVDFIKTYECEDTQSLEYGAIYSPEKTTFRVWAPFATSVEVNLYDNGTSGDATSVLKCKKRIPEGGKWGGVWETDVSDDLVGVYYTYTVDNGGLITETIDPYAKAAGVNGMRGMVVDLDATDPEGWENDKHLYGLFPDRADTPIVWEVQVKDFSSSADSGMKYKGKYLAFTEENTTVPGKPNLPTGVNYLKQLGITYVHLNPVYDFATVDESDMSIADDTHDNFNWGYDPQNYNVPEGSYSTDPTRGEVRITEFKQMVMALHKAGIGVIMDVVYNHTYATGGQALNDTVPNYYHRTDNNGAFTDDSGCGNGTASERTMMRKYMIESLKYWATEYHVDGFRFDLMGIHDTRTLNMIRDMFDEEVEDGKHILMYGEPWSGDGGYVAASYTNRVNATKTQLAGVGKYTYNGDNGYLTSEANNMFKQNSWDWAYNTTKALKDRIAIFGDSGRNALRGDNKPGQGWANGNTGTVGGVQKMMEGYCGTSGYGITSRNGSQSVAYAAAHDNYTLWDQMVGAPAGEQTPLVYDYPDTYKMNSCKLIASAYLLSMGIPFMLAGEEMGRTKYGNHNSYNSPSKVNQLVWSRQEKFSDLLDTFKALIKLRLDNHDTYSYYSACTNPAACYYNFDGTGGAVLKFTKWEVGNLGISGTLNANTKHGTITDGKGNDISF
ncbi:MAG: hypothetical protein J1G38_04405 [Clostridiales bacterium]|nr:hypothetical protein [Clostridiales bacterium]